MATVLRVCLVICVGILTGSACLADQPPGLDGPTLRLAATLAEREPEKARRLLESGTAPLPPQFVRGLLARRLQGAQATLGPLAGEASTERSPNVPLAFSPDGRQVAAIGMTLDGQPEVRF